MKTIWGYGWIKTWLFHHFEESFSVSTLCEKVLHGMYNVSAKQYFICQSLFKVPWRSIKSYCESSSRSSVLPAVFASCSGVTPSSFGRLTAIKPPGWHSNSSARRYRPHRTARWRGDSLGLCSGDEAKIQHNKKDPSSDIKRQEDLWRRLQEEGKRSTERKN